MFAITAVGKKIKELRGDKGISARELSRRSGISQSYLSQIETGKNNNPTNEVLNKLAEGLNISYHNLLFILGFIDSKEAIQESIKHLKDKLVINLNDSETNSDYAFEKIPFDLYFELLTLTEYKLFYKGVELYDEEIKDIMKFIEAFVLNKDGEQ